MIVRIIKLTASFAALIALLWLSYPYIETARLAYSATGIDVSHHQGAIDWPRVAAAGVRFVYIKATEGGDFRDPDFVRNWDEARAAGIAVGAYHFYRQCKSGAEQAANLLAVLPRGPQLPPVIDAEHMGPCNDGSTFDPAIEIAVLLDRVALKVGCRPILYVTTEFEATYLSGKFNADRFWVRSIFLPPSIRQDSWIFWQYHHAGRRDGIDGPVDLNAFRGDVLPVCNNG